MRDMIGKGKASVPGRGICSVLGASAFVGISRGVLAEY